MDEKINIYVDGACSGNPGDAQYRIVGNDKTTEIYRSPKFLGTNNIAEYLALCHAVLLMNRDHPDKQFIVWSDSVTAMAWFRDRMHKSTIEDSRPDAVWAIEKLNRATESIQRVNKFNSVVKKWDTKSLGEIPADFGNKKGKKK
jgi:ribonuclease HI